MKEFFKRLGLVTAILAIASAVISVLCWAVATVTGLLYLGIFLLLAGGLLLALWCLAMLIGGIIWIITGKWIMPAWLTE